MQRTLAIIKPDGVAQRHVGDVIKRIETDGFRIVADRGVKPRGTRRRFQAAVRASPHDKSGLPEQHPIRRDRQVRFSSG